MAHGYRKPGASRFALFVSATVLVVGEGMVLAGYATGIVWPDQLAVWSLFPAALALVTFLAVRSFKGERTLPASARTYSLQAPAYREAAVGDLVGRLRERGYALVAPPTGEAELGGREVSFRDRRFPPETGELRIHLRVQDSGALLGFVEALDTGPGFYDELAQFALVELAALEPELAYAVDGAEPRPAALLEEELPGTPYGLALLP